MFTVYLTTRKNERTEAITTFDSVNSSTIETLLIQQRRKAVCLIVCTQDNKEILRLERFRFFDIMKAVFTLCIEEINKELFRCDYMMMNCTRNSEERKALMQTKEHNQTMLNRYIKKLDNVQSYA